MHFSSRSHRRSLPSVILWVLVLLLALPVLIAARQGPPPHVVRAVDATVELLRSNGDAALRGYLDEAVDPAWREDGSDAALLERLRAVRAAVGGRIDELDVEGAPEGVVLHVGAGGAAHRVALEIGEAGVRGIELLAPPPEGGPPSSRQEAVRGHLQALERSHRAEPGELLREFEERRFSERFLAATTPAERRALLDGVRAAAAAAGAALLDEDDGEVTLTLRGREETRVIFRVEDSAPFGIDGLRLEAGAEGPELSWETVEQSFERLAAAGFSGVLHLARKGETVLERAYGMANRELGIPMSVDTILGIGSTPISFTVAGIRLLAQRGVLSLDDPVSRHLDGVPDDKRALTIRHLISGRSGLPDFHDQPGDWDADLAWIDRDEAVRRILAQPLLFEPGSGRAHSHSAYGLAAAILEIVSGRDYESFLRETLFEPAGMTRTLMYGDRGDFELADFAVGYGPSAVGLPNIPPNWGPTSWLVLGSGGMASTLHDMLRFHRFTRGGDLFEGEHADAFSGELVGVGGSERGFYIFEALDDDGDVAMLLINGEGRTDEIRGLSRALERLVMDD